MAGSSTALPPLAERTDAFEESEIRRMFDLAEEQDGDLVRMEIGEPDFDTPEHIVDACTDAARAGATHYTHNAGITELREAIAGRYARQSDRSVDPDSEVAVTVGAMQAVNYALQAVADPGDEVVVPTPGWVNYFTIADLLNLEAVEAPLPADEGFDLVVEPIETAISEDTSAIVINSPSNPTGRVYDADAIRQVVELAADYDAFVIADEVYDQITYEDDLDGVTSVTAEYDNVVTINSFSKTYAMTGWRVGWMIAPPPIVDAARKFQQGTTTCAPSIAQHAAIEALEGPQEPIEEMIAAFARRREFVVNRIAKLPAVSCPTPQGGFYAFLDVSALGDSSFEVARRLLDDYGVVMVPGSGFGDHGEGYLRISFANDLERLQEGFDRFEAFLDDELEERP
jgi:aspartate aminotransferase